MPSLFILASLYGQLPGLPNGLVRVVYLALHARRLRPT